MLRTPRRPRARRLVVTACLLVAGGLAGGCSGGPDPVTDVTARSATLNAHGKCDGGTPTPCEYQWRWRRTGASAWTTGTLYGPVRGSTPEVALHEKIAGLTPDTPYEWQIGARGDSISTMAWSAGPSFRTRVAPPADPSGEPVPSADLPGFKQVFSDDFSTDVPLGQFPSAVASTWWAYPTTFQDTSKNGTYDCARVCSVADGVLKLHLHTAGGLHRVAAPVPKLPGSTPLPPYGVPSGQLHGRYSVRFKADPVPGYKTAWLLWPDSDVWPRDGEIDFPEGNLDGTIGAFLHRQDATVGWDEEHLVTDTSYVSWHTATTEWTAQAVRFLLDGEVILTSTQRLPSTPMHWVLQTETQQGVPPPPDSAQGRRADRLGERLAARHAAADEGDRAHRDGDGGEGAAGLEAVDRRRGRHALHGRAQRGRRRRVHQGRRRHAAHDGLRRLDRGPRHDLLVPRLRPRRDAELRRLQRPRDRHALTLAGPDRRAVRRAPRPSRGRVA